MRKILVLIIAAMLFFLAACRADSPACPRGTGTPHYLETPPGALPTVTPASFVTPLTVEIGGKTVTVDKIVEGPLCNDTWRGTVYVTCNVQVYSWEETPLFLKDCNLDIEPDTVVYVAYHNNTAYYNGCSCHTGEIAEP